MSQTKRVLTVKDTERLLDFRATLRKSCSLCPLGARIDDNNYWPVGSRGAGRIVFVGHAPGEEEHLNGQAFVGRAGKLTDHLLADYCGLGEDQLNYTNATRCAPGEGVTSAGSYRACAPYLLKELAIIDPVLIVFFGHNAASGVVSKIDNPGTGQFFQTNIGGKKRTCFIMPHPAVIFHSPKMKRSVTSHLEQLGAYIYQEFGYRGRRTPTESANHEISCTVVDTVDKLKAMYEDIITTEGTLRGADTETSGLKYYRDDFELVGISLSPTIDRGYYIPLAHEHKHRLLSSSKALRQLDWQTQVRPVLQKIISESDKQLVFHNLSFDYIVLRLAGIKIDRVNSADGPWQVHDSMLVAYYEDEMVHSFGLKEQVRLRFHRNPPSFKEVLGGESSIKHVPLERAAYYACEDSCNSLAVALDSLKSVKKQSSLRTGGKLLKNIYPNDLNMSMLTAEASLYGLRVDQDYLLKVKKDLERSITDTLSKLKHISNVASPSSTSQVKALFTKILDSDTFLPDFEQSYGELSTDESQLKNMIKLYKDKYKDQADAGGVGIGDWEPETLAKYVRYLIRYRQLAKMLSTYIEPLLEEASVKDGSNIIHPSYKITVTTSGRLSSGSIKESN